MLRHWFIPRPCGDFRLTALEGKQCLLTVEDPTAIDREKLKPFLAMAVREGWTDAGVDSTILDKGLTRITLRIAIAEAGPVLALASFPKNIDTWTAVRFANGEIVVEDGVGTSVATAVDTAVATSVDTTVNTSTPAAAVTIAAPRLGCPAPAAAVRRASEVLRTFSTVSQYRDFERRGRMVVHGGRTGNKYHVFHRDEAARLGMGHVVRLAGGEEICVWDDAVPAEEEMLGIKLMIEHREERLVRGKPWLLDA